MAKSNMCLIRSKNGFYVQQKTTKGKGDNKVTTIKSREFALVKQKPVLGPVTTKIKTKNTPYSFSAIVPPPLGMGSRINSGPRNLSRPPETSQALPSNHHTTDSGYNTGGEEHRNEDEDEDGDERRIESSFNPQPYQFGGRSKIPSNFTRPQSQQQPSYAPQQANDAEEESSSDDSSTAPSFNKGEHTATHHFPTASLANSARAWQENINAQQGIRPQQPPQGPRTWPPAGDNNIYQRYTYPTVPPNVPPEQLYNWYSKNWPDAPAPCATKRASKQ